MEPIKNKVHQEKPNNLNSSSKKKEGGLSNSSESKGDPNSSNKNLLKDLKAMRTFMLREMHGICAVYKDDQKEYLKKDEFFLIFPKKKLFHKFVSNFWNHVTNNMIKKLHFSAY